MTHTIKTHLFNFGQWIHRNKSFEIRRDDRQPQYAIGDIIHQREYDPATRKYTGRIGCGRVMFIQRGFAGIERGYCVLEVPFDHMVVDHSKTDKQIADELNSLE